jgi:transcriptional regulator with XRE-family HTH domain
MNKTLTEQIKSINVNIRCIREHKHYSQDYLAAKLGISQNAYSKLELGRTNLTLERLFFIAQIL